ncbi:MAG: YafY family transcriptional regulator [Betaproteobacteria bacterium]|nr:YafY family transcriptional regulator [Betaproteobacteria bacterium]
MSKTERLFLMHQMLRERGGIRRDEVMERFEISQPTFKRDLEYLRDRAGAQIEYDKAEGIYRLKTAGKRTGFAMAGDSLEMPGLWFSQEEMHALLSLHQMLQGIGVDGLLGGHLSPIKDRIETLLSARMDVRDVAAEAPSALADQIRRRIRILPMASRRLPAEHFTTVSDAVLKRKRLSLEYEGRSRGERTEREVSPQRLVHYRDNWYLDAYCHLRERLSTFAVDAIRKAKLSKRVAIEIDEKELNDVLASGYGIFSGRPKGVAKLIFSTARSRWVADEIWHPDQQGEWRGSRWLVSFPYSDTRELVMDIMRHGPEVQVLEPTELALEVRELHRKAAHVAPLATP